MKPDCTKCTGQHICCSQNIRITPMDARILGIDTSNHYLTTRGELCMFFNEDTKGCNVYHKRPRACREFNCCNPKQLKCDDPRTLELAQNNLTPDVWLKVELSKRDIKQPIP